MKTIKITCLLFVALWPSIIQGSGSSDDEMPDVDKPYNDIREKVDAIMKNGELINNIFKPLQFIGIGSFSVNYKGELGEEKKMVLMKISPNWTEDGEYDIYTYMMAIDNKTVENYGIPAVYYYHENWEGCNLLAITLLDPQFSEEIRKPNITLNDLDILIIMREFVRTSKYIHFYGVCHAHMHFNNLMFRRNDGFIIDFNLSFESEREITPNSDCRKKDWQDFLKGLVHFCGIKVGKMNDHNLLKAISKIENNEGLKYILMHFAKHAFKVKDAEPINYNRMHQMITREIRRREEPEPAFVSWLTLSQQNEAEAEWSTKPPPPIESIPEPGCSYPGSSYPEPVLDYFHNFK